MSKEVSIVNNTNINYLIQIKLVNLEKNRSDDFLWIIIGREQISYYFPSKKKQKVTKYNHIIDDTEKQTRSQFQTLGEKTEQCAHNASNTGSKHNHIYIYFLRQLLAQIFINTRRRFHQGNPINAKLFPKYHYFGTVHTFHWFSFVYGDDRVLRPYSETDRSSHNSKKFTPTR